MNSIALIPAYDEEVAIGSVVLRCLQYVDDVLVIDDGSSDKTSEISKLAGAKVITHGKNLGKGMALKSGFDVLDYYDIIVTIDGDGQHNPDEIPKLLQPIIEGNADFVNGSRYLNGPEENTPSYRRVGQKVLDIATNISSSVDVTDSQSGFRAFSKKTCDSFKFRDTGFGIESEMLADAAEDYLKIVEVPITVRYDVDGSTKNPISHGFGVLFKIVKDKIYRVFRRD
ncbi:glycosyltransferase family 2 protein [Methanobrevibacter sp. DSM 116169]|uniref:glycosyltransferase family 2 protein n=1 Tax=Methanobrevibacter sp. DSM 116169 TaxID=3242727 RepID=UPI0038FC3F8D